LHYTFQSIIIVTLNKQHFFPMYNKFKFLIAIVISAILLLSCKHVSTIQKTDTNVYTLDSASAKTDDTSFLRIIKPYKENMAAEMNAVLAYTDEAMIKDKPEGLLNNFVSDLIFIKAKEYYKPDDGKQIDFCILNSGGLRTAFPKGAITRSKIFELMPFDNKVVVVTLTPEKTLQLFNYIAKAGGIPVSGLSMGIKDTSAVNVLIDGKKFDNTRSYKIATSDYLANGGDKMYFFSKPVNLEDLDIKIRDAIISYVTEENKKGNKLHSKLDKRIYYEK